MEDLWKAILQGDAIGDDNHPLLHILRQLDQRWEPSNSNASPPPRSEAPPRPPSAPSSTTTHGTVTKSTPVDMFLCGDIITVYMEIPGVSKSDIDINLGADNTLMIGIDKRCPYPKEGAACLLKERKYGYMNRVVRLPKEVDPTHIHAKYDHGVLCIQCGVKKACGEVRRITVE